MSYLQHVTADGQFDDPLPELARVNRFSMADLDHNRQGKISDGQWMRLLVRVLQPIRYTGGALLGWLFFCYAVKMIVPGFVLWIMAKFGFGIALTGGITLAAVCAFLISVIKSAHKMGQLLVDLSAGKAVYSEGRVSGSHEDEKGLGLARFWGETNTNYWYVINNEYFEVDPAAHGALPDRMQFRLYHTPRSKMLLSIEPKPAAASTKA
jgi:hypothetical protein